MLSHTIVMIEDCRQRSLGLHNRVIAMNALRTLAAENTGEVSHLTVIPAKFTLQYLTIVAQIDLVV